MTGEVCQSELLFRVFPSLVGHDSSSVLLEKKLMQFLMLYNVQVYLTDILLETETSNDSQ